MHSITRTKRGVSSFWYFTGVCLHIFVVVFSVNTPGVAQEAVPESNSQVNANSSASPKPTPVPFAEIVAQTERALTTLKQIDASLVSEPGAEIVERDLPGLIAEIDLRSEETARIIEGRASLERLRSVEAEWKSVTKRLGDWDSTLTGLAKKFEADLKNLAGLSEKWNKSLESLQNVETPPEVVARVNTVISEISRLKGEIETIRARVVGLQSKVAEQATRTDDSTQSIQQTRESLVGQLLVQDSPALWTNSFWSRAKTESTNDSLEPQGAALVAFATQNSGRLVFHFLLFLAFAGILMFLRRFADPWIEKDPTLKNAAIIFSLPVSTAAILAIFINGWIYTQTPQILQAVFGAVALVPTVIIVRKLVERPIYPLLYSLVAFYLIDQFRMVVEGLPLISRLVFFTEMVIGLLFFLWLVIGRLATNKTEENVYGSVFRTIRIAAVIAVPLFAASAIANLLGYSALAQLVGNAVLRSAYAAIVLYAVIRIVDGLIIFALRFRPFSLLGMVQNNRFLIQYRLRRVTRWAGILIWAFVVLDLLAVRETVTTHIGEALRSELKIGSLAISLGDVLAFVVAVWGSFLISRFIRFALEEDIFPRISIARGLPYAISTVLHYVLIVFGFLIALAIVGIDLTKFTIIAGAFGVGIGFGLQNIVNNFVSGIILLFERPVNVGDTVQVGGDSGDLTRIGLRASVIRTLEGSEVIVPNGDLISEKVVNWTLSDQQRRLEINVGVAYGSDPRKVVKILTNVGSNNSQVLADPAPNALFLGFGDSSLDFQLRAWTDKFDEWVRIKSDLALAIHDALNEEQIEIPFPQLDLKIRR